jgi:uncharacterized protein DUF3574
MRGLTVGIGVALFAAGIGAGTVGSPRAGAQGFAVVMECGGVSTPQVRTTLYFGLTRATGAISQLEWQLFLRDEVTRRFPDGLTSWDAQGQWRSSSGTIDQERAKVLLIVHAETAEARRSVQEVISAYRRQFEQQSVLWESARVCTSL